VDAERYLSAIKEQRRILSELKLPRANVSKLTLADHIAKRSLEQAIAEA
jgi:hypothetical protein